MNKWEDHKDEEQFRAVWNYQGKKKDDLEGIGWWCTYPEALEEMKKHAKDKYTAWVGIEWQYFKDDANGNEVYCDDMPTLIEEHEKEATAWSINLQEGTSKETEWRIKK